MNNRVSVLYTCRNPWPRRLALAAVVLLLLGAAGLTTAQRGGVAPQHSCASAARN